MWSEQTDQSKVPNSPEALESSESPETILTSSGGGALKEVKLNIIVESEDIGKCAPKNQKQTIK